MTRYGTTETVDLAVITCLWWGSLHRTPIRVVLVRGTSQARPYTLAPATTDLASTGGQIVARYASRWSSNSSRRRAAPWYRHKRHVSTEDMIIACRRARVTGNTAAQDTPALFDAPASTSQATAA